MSGSAEEPSVVITATPHVQPAVLALARACITLARLQKAEEKSQSTKRRRHHGEAPTTEEQSHE